MSFQIVMAQEPWDKFHAYTELCNEEVAAFGYCTPDAEQGQLYVDEIFLVPQEVTAGEVDFVTDGLPFALERAIKDERLEHLRFCVHSHVNMGVQFSLTDDEMVRSMKEGSPGLPWFASAVFNKAGKTNARVDLFETALPGLDHITVNAEVLSESGLLLHENAQAELDEYVEKQKPVQLAPAKKKDKKNGRDDHMIPTWRDDMLHEEAKRRGWERVVEDDIAYYFESEGDGTTSVFKGSAPLSPDHEGPLWMGAPWEGQI